MGANHMMDFERKKFNFRTSSFSSLESFSWPSYPSFSPFMGFTPKYTLNISNNTQKFYLREDISSF